MSSFFSGCFVFASAFVAGAFSLALSLSFLAGGLEESLDFGSTFFSGGLDESLGLANSFLAGVGDFDGSFLAFSFGFAVSLLGAAVFASFVSPFLEGDLEESLDLRSSFSAASFVESLAFDGGLDESRDLVSSFLAGVLDESRGFAGSLLAVGFASSFLAGDFDETLLLASCVFTAPASSFLVEVLEESLTLESAFCDGGFDESRAPFFSASSHSCGFFQTDSFET